jgi:hypothetical protein
MSYERRLAFNLRIRGLALILAGFLAGILTDYYQPVKSSRASR